LTPAGTTFLQDIRRLFTNLEQARENVRAIAAGLRGSVRIAISDGAIDPRLSALLALCRQEEPEIEYGSPRSPWRNSCGDCDPATSRSVSHTPRTSATDW
jgi:DNA-binding transcriptional LysR family regulator